MMVELALLVVEVRRATEAGAQDFGTVSQGLGTGVLVAGLVGFAAGAWWQHRRHG